MKGLLDITYILLHLIEARCAVGSVYPQGDWVHLVNFSILFLQRQQHFDFLLAFLHNKAVQG